MKKALPLFVQVDKEFIPVSGFLQTDSLKVVKKTLISDAISKYLEIIASKKSEKSKKNEDTYFVEFLQYTQVKKIEYIDEISFEILDSYRSKLNSRMINSSVNRVFNSIKRFLRACYEWEYHQQNLSSKVKKIKEEKNPYDIWTEKQFLLIYNDLPYPWNNMLKFLWITGCRPIELVNLKWTEVDFDKLNMRLECGKNTNFKRDFPITNEISKLLHQINLKSNHVFTFKNRPIKADNLYQAVKKRLRKHNLGHLSLYGLRHSFATRLAESGVNAFYIQELMGHSDIKTSAGYIKKEKNMLIDVLKKIK